MRKGFCLDFADMLVRRVKERRGTCTAAFSKNVLPCLPDQHMRFDLGPKEE